MRGARCWITFGAALLSFVWAGSALGNGASPKNIIIMIGDGFGFEQADAGRLLAPLVLDSLDPNPGSVNTLEVFGEITDSAAGATAFATGCKTEYGNVSMAEDDMTILPTNMQAAQTKGMAVGILSSVYMCDATPGVWLAHAPSRSCSTIIPQQIDACPDVFLGPGETVAYKTRGRSKKGVDYVAEFVDNCGHEEVRNAAELAAATAPNDRLLGIWQGYTLRYDIDRQNDPGSSNIPTLAAMTEKAIEVLNRNENGFMLMVEGGAIDWMAHNKDVAGTARDVVAFDEAIAVAYAFAQADGETALIVTADHETGGLDLGNNPNAAFIESITASTKWMGELIDGKKTSLEDVLSTYAGVDDLTQAEKDAIEAYGEEGIADALNVRANVQWILPNGDVSIAPDEGEHSDYDVPVWAYGPGTAGNLEGSIDNTDIGKLLFDLVSGVSGSAPACPVIGP